MVTISRFISLTQTDAEGIDHDVDEWLDSLAQPPGAEYVGQMYHSGWSPAEFDPPKRAASNVRRVFALVLDHDHGADFDRLVDLWSGFAGVVYTTKSHTPEAPRYRVVLALVRPVTADEYARLWGWGADRSQAAACPVDQTCKDASRFWYDPSMPAGGDWRAARLTGAPIDPDATIALLPQAPTLRVVRPARQPDASDRVRRARAYLAKLPAAVSGQAGHLAAWNAVAHMLIGFDLPESDAYDLIASEYNPRCDPPWSERELRHKLSSVAQRCSRERGYLLTERPRIESTRTAASYAPPLSEVVDIDWATKMLRGDKGKTRRAYHNTAVFVRHHPEYRGRWSLDTMTRQPWFDGRPLDPSFVHHIRAQADCMLGYTPAPADVDAAIIAAAQDRPFHPIRQYLRSLDWDGELRLSSMARDYFASTSPLHAEMVRRWMIGAAARALWPGCKLDTALMLVGPQGYRKSTFFSVLGGQWHSDSYLDINNFKDATLQLHAAWIYELSELENVVTDKAESRLKAWMSSRVDHVRPPYAKETVAMPRAVSLVGTTNREQILTDVTGSRRFWIIPVLAEIPWELLEGCRDQLWAEATCAAESGEPWWLSREADEEREVAARSFETRDSWEEVIRRWLDRPSARQDSVTMTEALEVGVGLEPGRHGRSEQMRVSRILKSIGWRRVNHRNGDSREWRYDRPVPTGVGAK
jgi:hypothetical protein